MTTFILALLLVALGILADRVYVEWRRRRRWNNDLDAEHAQTDIPLAPAEPTPLRPAVDVCTAGYRPRHAWAEAPAWGAVTDAFAVLTGANWSPEEIDAIGADAT